MKLLKKVAALILVAAMMVASPEILLPGVSFSASAATTTLGSTTLKVTAAKKGYSFSWSEVKNADGYEIEYSTNGGKNYYSLVETGSGISGITVTTLDPSLSYRFRIRAFRVTSTSVVYGKYSSYVATKVVAASTKKPAKTNIVAKVSGENVKLSWTAVPNISKYQIYYSKDGKTFKLLKTVSGTKTTITVSGLDLSKSLRYKIRSYRVVSGKKVYSEFSSPAVTKAVSTTSTSTKAAKAGKVANVNQKNTSVEKSDKLYNFTTIPVSAVNSKLESVVGYLRQDLYVFKEKGSNKKQVYRITESAFKNYKKNKTLKAEKITVDSSIRNYEWEIDGTRLGTCDNVMLRYYGEKERLTYVTVKYNKSNKTLKVIYKLTGYLRSLTDDGYTMDGYYSYEGGKCYFNVKVMDPDGKQHRHKIFDCTNLSTSAGSDGGNQGAVWLFIHGYRNILIDVDGNETNYLTGNNAGYLGDAKSLNYYYETSDTYGHDRPMSDYHVYLIDEDESYDYKDFDFATFTHDGVYYDIRSIHSVSGTKGLVTFWNGYRYEEGDPNEFKRVGIKTFRSAINLETGKYLIPIFDQVVTESTIGGYVGAMKKDDTYLGVWYYNKNGKLLGKFDDGTTFDGKVALVADGNKLFFVDKNFKRVSGYTTLKGNDWSCFNLHEGLFAYESDGKGYFILYN